MMCLRETVLVVVALATGPAMLLARQAPAPNAAPERVFASGAGTWSNFEAMLADLARADVVFVGEQHDDPNTHRLELAVLEGLSRRRDRVVLSLEMFERDVQHDLDRFANGQISEDAFLSFTRPWPRYRTDYRPLVDFAVARRWPIVAANVPRPFASEVAKAGWAAVDAKPVHERRWYAADRECPTGDEYYRRFAQAMSGHTADAAPAPASAEPDEKTVRYYQSQCLKDETMAESIVRAHTAAGDGALVVHMNGAFHSDFGLGTAARVRRRAPDRRVVVLSVLPVDSLDGIMPDEETRRRADYLVYTLRTK